MLKLDCIASSKWTISWVACPAFSSWFSLSPMSEKSGVVWFYVTGGGTGGLRYAEVIGDVIAAFNEMTDGDVIHCAICFLEVDSGAWSLGLETSALDQLWSA